MQKRLVAAVLGASLGVAPASIQAAPLEAWVDLSSQTMTVFVDGRRSYRWPVSTARPGKVTPTGRYTPEYLSRYHRSSLYNNAPMPYSIFFHGNYAIHGTDQIRRLGTPASAGCIRLHPDNAKVLWGLLKEVGKDNMEVVIQK